MNDYINRLQRLIAMLPESADGALVTSQVNRLYLTGYNADTGFLLVTRAGSAFVTDFRYIEAASAALDGVCEVIMYTKLSDSLAQLCERFAARTLLVEHSRLTLSEAASLAKALEPVKTVETAQLDNIIDTMRLSKTAAELEQIKAAQMVTERSFTRTLELVREGVTERELALELEFDMRRNGASAVSFELIIAAGANSSMPHAVPSDYRVRSGDFITFDIGAIVGGYHSDMTRTVALGRVTQEQRDVYNIVLRAQQAGLDYLLGGGRSCFEADKIARDIITQAGYGEYFGHSLGHGVGLDIHEAPALNARDTTTEMADGNVVTVEPGIYLPGKFGVRIEDMVYITADSAVDLASLSRELIEL